MTRSTLGFMVLNKWTYLYEFQFSHAVIPPNTIIVLFVFASSVDKVPGTE